MADFSEWGAEASPNRLMQRDTLEALKGGASVQEALGRIAMQPAELRYKTLQGDKLQFEIDQDKQVAELMRAAFGGQAADPSAVESGTVGAEGLRLEQSALRPQTSLADKFGNAAEIFAGAGQVKRAQELAKTASTLRQQQAAAISSQTTALLNQLKITRENAENLAQFFGGAGSQEELDQANRLYQFQTGQPSPFQNVPFSEDLIDGLNQRALSAKERFDLADKAATRLNLKTYRDARLGQFETENRIREERLRLNREREERLRKQGGGRLPSADPKPDEIRQVKAMIRKDFPMAKDFADEMGTAAFTIAAEARAKMRANPALSPSAALNQAYTEAVRFGDIEADAGTAFGLIGKKFRFAGGGRSPETALTVPSKATDARPGRYYVNSRGDVAKWDGKKFVPVQVNSNRLSSDNGNPNSEEY